MMPKNSTAPQLSGDPYELPLLYVAAPNGSAPNPPPPRALPLARSAEPSVQQPAALLCLGLPHHKTVNTRMGFGLLLVAAAARIFQEVYTASAHLSHRIKF